MGEVKDPKMKLFGTTIELRETVESGEVSGEGNSVAEDGDFSADAEDRELNEDRSHSMDNGVRTQDGSEPLTLNKPEESNMPRAIAEDSKVVDPSVGMKKTLKTEGDHTELQDKALKKPDKILPCPRCNSMDTKFCYFNNYNVNQPRHFCKNCQRYWTAGGTMRNVPVGAGRRRNKAQFRQQTPPAAEPSRVDFPNPIQSNNSTLCESMVSVLNIADQMIRPNPGEVSLSGSIENGNDCASYKEKLGNNETPPEMIPNCPSVPYFPGASWPYTWQSVQWSAPVYPPSFVPGGFPLPFYSTAPPFWSVPWMIPTTLGSGPNSPTLGKHSRDDESEDSPNSKGNKEAQKDSNPEKCLWIPKTLRIDDPGEAAKSSIWATLGIVKNENGDEVRGGNLFKPLQSQSKGADENAKVQVPEASSTVLQANPAALSRSLSFHESL